MNSNFSHTKTPKEFLKKYWKITKLTFCTPKDLIHDDKISNKLKKEEYLTYFLFLVIAWILEILTCYMNWMPVLFCIAFSALNISLFYLLKQGHIILIKQISLFVFTGVGSFIYLLKSDEYALPIQVCEALCAPLCLMVTRSLKSSLFVYFINLAQSIFFLMPRMMSYFKFTYEENQGQMLILVVALCFGIGWLLIGVFWVLLESRAKLILKLAKEKKNVENANNQLLFSNKELQQILEVQENLLQSISFELRYPFNQVSGAIDLLLKENIDPKLKGYCDQIKGATQLISHQINKLNYTKFETDQQKLVPKKVESCILVENIWNTTKLLIKKKGLNGQILISKNIPEKLEVDSIRIMQILHNLVSNATKFTDEGYVSIICSSIESEKLDLNMIQPSDEDLFRQYLYTKKHQKDKENENNFELHTILGNSLISKIKDLRDPSDLDSLEGEGHAFTSNEHLPYLISKGIKTFSYRRLLDNYYKLGLDDNHFLFERKNGALKLGSNKVISDKIRYLKIEVIDSGCGINENKMEKLKKTFEDQDRNCNKIEGGLGLLITRNLCLKMKGDLKFYSTVDQGSVFVAVVAY